MIKEGEPKVENELEKAEEAVRDIQKWFLVYSKDKTGISFKFKEIFVDPREKYLREKYADSFGEYYLYHVFSFSSPEKGRKFDKLDFEGNDSILGYLEKLKKDAESGEDIFSEKYIEKLRESEKL